jgi:hypothetical protein
MQTVVGYQWLYYQLRQNKAADVHPTLVFGPFIFVKTKRYFEYAYKKYQERKTDTIQIIDDPLDEINRCFHCFASF